MYAVFSNNKIAFKVLVEFDADLLWRNSTGAGLLQALAKKGFVDLAEIALQKLKSNQEDVDKFLNNKNDNSKYLSRDLRSIFHLAETLEAKLKIAKVSCHNC